MAKSYSSGYTKLALLCVGLLAVMMTEAKRDLHHGTTTKHETTPDHATAGWHVDIVGVSGRMCCTYCEIHGCCCYYEDECCQGRCCKTLPGRGCVCLEGMNCCPPGF